MASGKQLLKHLKQFDQYILLKINSIKKFLESWQEEIWSWVIFLSLKSRTWFSNFIQDWRHEFYPTLNKTWFPVLTWTSDIRVAVVAQVEER